MNALRPFSIAGTLHYCPECGATGDYALLRERSEKVIAEWSAAGGYPDTADERERIGEAIAALSEAIDRERPT